jgi:predicted double-glycine peptidase
MSLKELRLREAFRTTLRQQYDFSCGSAAVATLLTHHYGLPTSEEAVFRAMYEGGDQKRIQREGFSLLDMKRYLEAKGFEADGFEASLDKLAEARVPAIVLVREHGYNHFVVIKGVANGKVLFSDPASGTRILPRQQFEGIWYGGVLFVIRSHREAVRFNVAGDWVIGRRAPITDGIDRSGIGSMMLMLPGANDF